jgi:anti-sigma factor RsiW
MDHRYIDARSVAERYLDHTLPAPERLQFEAHLVDCQECTDRVLLAEMFHHRNGALTPPPQAAHRLPQATQPAGARRMHFAFTTASWRLFLILTGVIAALVLAASLRLIWVLILGGGFRR